jgi:hypothetical protein
MKEDFKKPCMEHMIKHAYQTVHGWNIDKLKHTLTKKAF